MSNADEPNPPAPHKRRRPRMLGVASFRESLQLLSTRRFGTFWFASLLSSIGTWAQQVAEPWLLLTLGASSFVIGLDSFAMNAPVLLLTLVGGMLADRSDRRRVILLFQSIQMLCPVAIVVLLLAGRIEAWMILALSLVVGITDALSMPSFQSIVPSIVAPEQIGRALALNSTQFNLSRILGPAIAGALMSSVGVIACFVVSAASYIPFVGVALWILPRRAARGASPASEPRRPLFAGVRDVLQQRAVRGALLNVLVSSVLCAPLITFVPVLVRDVFQGGAAHFSMAVAAFGVGGLIGAAGLLGVAPGIDQRRLASGFAIGFAVVLVLISLSSWSLGLPPLLVLAGASMTISNTAANSVLQTSTHPRLLGQAVSLYMLALRGGISLGALITGASVTLFGVQQALFINGLLAVVAQTLLAWLWVRGAAAHKD